MKYIFTAIFLLTSAFAWSQAAVNVKDEVIAWDAIHHAVTEQGDTLTFTCVLTTYNTSAVDLQIGSDTHHFEVEQTTGEWQDIAQDGSITYYVNTESTEFIALERNSAGVKVHVDFSATGGAVHDFTVHSYTVK